MDCGLTVYKFEVGKLCASFFFALHKFASVETQKFVPLGRHLAGKLPVTGLDILFFFDRTQQHCLGNRHKQMRALFNWFICVFGVILAVYSLVASERSALFGGKKVVVVYAGRTYHEEVTASMACLLQEIGFHVVVYIENGFTWAGVTIPFTEKRIFSSRSFYGHCVDEFVTINGNMRIVDQPAVLLFVTYPMMNYGRGNGKDTYSFDLLKRMNRTSTKLVLVSHHAEHFWIQVDELSKYFHANGTTFLFLAKHVQESADKLIRQHPHLPRFRTDYVFPVFKLDKVIGRDLLHKTNSAWNSTPTVVTYSIQGNFGGKHAHRKDLHGTTNCLNALGAALKQPNATQQNVQEPHPHTHKGYFRLPAHTKNGKGNSTSAQHMLSTLRLDLVGHLEPNALKAINPVHFKLTTSGDVSHPQFYTRLSKAKFLLTALGSEAYSHTQATSTVPAAVITYVPLLTTAAFLQLYPCLRDQPLLRRINGATECESIHNAYALSKSDYARACKEMEVCLNSLWAESLTRMKHIVVDEE